MSHWHVFQANIIHEIKYKVSNYKFNRITWDLHFEMSSFSDVRIANVNTIFWLRWMRYFLLMAGDSCGCIGRVIMRQKCLPGNDSSLRFPFLLLDIFQCGTTKVSVMRSSPSAYGDFYYLRSAELILQQWLLNLCRSMLLCNSFQLVALSSGVNIGIVCLP